VKATYVLEGAGMALLALRATDDAHAAELASDYVRSWRLSEATVRRATIPEQEAWRRNAIKEQRHALDVDDEDVDDRFEVDACVLFFGDIEPR
jgi:hypothetical protein